MSLEAFILEVGVFEEFDPHIFISSFKETRMTTSIKRSTETVGQTDINTCIVSELNNNNINV